MDGEGTAVARSPACTVALGRGRQRSPIFADICRHEIHRWRHRRAILSPSCQPSCGRHKIPIRSPQDPHKIAPQDLVADTHKIARDPQDWPTPTDVARFTATSPRDDTNIHSSPIFTAPSPCDSPRVRDIAATSPREISAYSPRHHRAIHRDIAAR